MKLLHRQFDLVRRHFAPGGRLAALGPLFEGIEGFHFVLPKRTLGGCHVRDSLDTKRLMVMVIIALLPVVAFGIYNAGYQHYAAQGGLAAAAGTSIFHILFVGAWHVVPIIVVSYAAGGTCEVIFACVRKHEINEGFLVTGLLLPLTLPPSTPLWLVAVGICFGVVFGKEVYGGTGMNIFNPALTARALIFFAYPQAMSGDAVWRIVPATVVDGYSGATPLAVAGAGGQSVVATLNSFGVTAAGVRYADYSWGNLFFGLIPGSIGETSTLMCLIGAAILLVAGVASWRVMAAMWLGATVTALGFNLLAPGAGSLLALPPYYHWVMGGFAFGLVFMATDPVSAPGTAPGQWLYGLAIGVLCITVRVLNPAFPEGVMLSILFMNAFSGLLDYVFIQRAIKRRRQRAEAVH